MPSAVKESCAVLSILSGLLSSLSYAASDLFSQNVTRHTRVLTQMVWVLATGVVVVVPIALLVVGLPQGEAQWRAAGFAALAGALYFFAFFCLLRALSTGDLGLVSTLNALQGAYVAVTVILLGAKVTPLLALALSACVLGGLCTSFEGHAKTAKGAPWALASGLLFAAVMLCYHAAGAISWLSQSAISRSVSLLVTLPVALLSGRIYVPRNLRGRAIGAGLLELGGVVLLTIAFAIGPPTVAGVTTTQFGTFAVLLGYVVLHERPNPLQWAGVGCTLAGVSLLAAIG
jgi:drug/metabolite transporter (DMT)-like permease